MAAFLQLQLREGQCPSCRLWGPGSGHLERVHVYPDPGVATEAAAVTKEVGPEACGFREGHRVGQCVIWCSVDPIPSLQWFLPFVTG